MMQIIPLDDPKTTGQLVRHEHVLIDGVDVKRHGRPWYVTDHRGIPCKVEFGYLNAATDVACVYVHRKVTQGRGKPSHPAGYNDLVPALAPNTKDIDETSETHLKALGYLGDILDLIERTPDPAGQDIADRLSEADDMSEDELKDLVREAEAWIDANDGSDVDA